MKKESGQSLFEVVFAIGVSALIITTIVILAGNAVANSTFSKNKAVAGKFASEAIEWLRGERDADWDTFYSYTGVPTWCLPSLDWDLAKPTVCQDSDTISTTSNFKREINFVAIDSQNVETKVRVYWQDGRGLHEVSTITNFTDWRRQ